MTKVVIDPQPPWGVSWHVADEPMQRASHALAHDGRVWLIDPVDDAAALEAVAGLSEPAAVLQLLDRHPRDCAAIAGRLGVPHLRLPATVPDAPFEVLRTVWVPGWRELRLWWAERRVLVVSEAIGTVPYFSAGRRAGVHPFLRLLPPRLRDHAPDHLLCGHGPAVHDDAAGALGEALDRSRRDVPKAAVAMLRSFAPGR